MIRYSSSGLGNDVGLNLPAEPLGPGAPGGPFAPVGPAAPEVPVSESMRHNIIIT
jgi:hypothetical protein